MFRASCVALLSAVLIVSGGLTGQDPKKDDPPARYKGVLPPNWKKLGLSDNQVQDIYKIQGKYNSEIDRLQAKIAELKTSRDKDLKSVLTPEQRKRLDEILTGKDK